MTRSGSINFNQTRNEIIESALRKIGALGEGEIPTAQQVTNASQELNRLVKTWVAKGHHLWALDELVIFPVVGQIIYKIGVDSNIANADDIVTTKVTFDVIVGSDTLILDSVEGLAVDDKVVVHQDNNTNHFSSIVSINNNEVILKDAVTGRITAGNTFDAFNKIADRPLKVEHARCLTSPNSEIEMDALGRQEYFRLSDKNSQGTPISYYFQPKLDHGEFRVWSTASSAKQQINITVQRNIEDFDTAANTPDFPHEWLQALVWNLAKGIGVEYGVDQFTAQQIAVAADMSLNDVNSWDNDNVGLCLTPDFS